MNNKIETFSLEAEQAVLGSLLIDNTTWLQVADQLTAKNFYKAEHQYLFQLIAQKLEKGESVDALTLSNEVKIIPALKGINGESYVFELMHNTHSTANVAAHAAIIKDHAQHRQIKELLQHLNTYADETDVKTLIQYAHTQFAQMELASLPINHGILSQLFSEIPHQPINWLWPERIARGKVSIIAGNPGLGKSQITASLAAIVTTGGIWPVDNTACLPGSVMFLSSEDDPGDTIGPRLKAAGADLAKARFLKCVQTKNKQGRILEKSFSLKTDIANLDKFLEEIHDITLLIIDPITAYLGETDSYKNAEVRALLAPLSELAAKYNLAIVGISHLNKAVGQDPLMRVSGSLAFVAAARAAYLVAQDPNDENRRFLLPMKNNIGDDKTGLAFSIQSHSLDNNIETSKIIWEQEAVSIKLMKLCFHKLTPKNRVLYKRPKNFFPTY
ncbi:MAG: AAA family ATPase [Pseudomonadota bacterium]